MNEELLTDFLEESYDLIEKVKTTLQHWNSQENKEEAVNSVYRWIHTIKGGCSMFNYNHTAKLAHELETYLGKLKEAKGVVKPEELNRVSSELTVIENLLRNGDQLGAAATEAPLPVVTEARKELKFATDYFQDYFNSSSHLLEDLYKDGYVFFEMVLPKEMSSKLIDKLNEHGFITISNEDVSGGVACLCSLNKNEGDYQLKKARQLIERFHGRWCSEVEEEKLPEGQPVNAITETTTQAPSAPVQTQEVLRVPLVTVNGILDHVWELFLVRNQMAHLFRENAQIFRDQHSFIQQFEALDTILERNIHELEGKTMSLRLSPLKKVFDRMKKVVADYCAQNGKKINFITKGEGIDLDKKVLDLLNEPLIHLVRNAIDHGVEKAEDRRLAGKEETGNVCLSAQIQGNEVLITLSDDGKGINPAKILESARKKIWMSHI